MSSKDTPIGVPADCAGRVGLAADRSQPSLAAPLECSARIGRAADRLPLLREHPYAAAHGTFATGDLTDEELAFFEEALALANPGPGEEAAFARHLREHGGGVGASNEAE